MLFALAAGGDHAPACCQLRLVSAGQDRRAAGRYGLEAAGLDTRPIRGVEFVKLADLPSLGFSERFGALAMEGFPGAGSYMGPKAAIGL